MNIGQYEGQASGIVHFSRMFRYAGRVISTSICLFVERGKEKEDALRHPLLYSWFLLD